MRGNEQIAKILLDNYGVNVGNYYDKLTWEITTDNQVERVTITFPARNPVNNAYCLCDGNWMLWYGDYGAFSFNCTWKASVKNIPAASPYYLWEKYESVNKHDQKEWSSARCMTSLLNTIRQSSGYEDLSEEQRSDLEDCLNNPFNSVWEYDSLEEHEEYLNQVVELFRAACEDRIEFQYKVREVEDDNNFIAAEVHDLYDIGDMLPKAFFILLYIFSIVQNEIDVKEV